MNNVEAMTWIRPIESLFFSTIYGDEVHTRVAQLLTADEEGFYFYSLKQKPFARQLADTGRVTIAGTHIYPHTPNPEIAMPAGYVLRMVGHCREISHKDVREKAKTNSDFNKLLTYDFVKYPNTVVYCLYKGKGDIFDYDFYLERRDRKFIRQRWGFGGEEPNPPGFVIDPTKCISCGACYEACSYNAIEAMPYYRIISHHCEECGACHNACALGAIEVPMVM